MATTVLLADDKKHVRGLVRVFLEEVQPDIVVIEVKNGAEAQAAFNAPEVSINFVITDFDFNSSMTGLELISWLRRNHPGIPILLMSSHDFEGEADEFLLKPFGFRAFKETFGRLLTRTKKPVA